MAETTQTLQKQTKAPGNFLANTSRSVMQKKFKLNDGANKYVEQSTLLEPANNATSLVQLIQNLTIYLQQHEQEEIREVSTQLSQIKKQHDDVKKLVNSRTEDLEKIKKEIDMLTNQESTAEGPVFQIRSRLEQLQDALDTTKLKIDEETMAKYTYSHVLERMKRDHIATKIKSTEFETSLKSKSYILDLENQKQRRTKEERLQSKAIFDSLMKNIEKEQKDRQERILELQKCIRNKEESVQRRIERQRRNQEIAEAAANENKDSSELKMRENLYIQKLWNAFMRKKMEKEMRESQSIDEAFKSIKTATGVTDVQEMVRKFLTREQTYSQLLMAVSESERKIDKLKKDNEELRGRLHELQIDITNQADKKTAAGSSQGSSVMDEELLELQRTQENVEKEYTELQDKFKRINIVNDQISGWAKRVFIKFAAMGESSQINMQQADLVKVFSGMNQVVVTELQRLIEKQQEEDKAIEYGDVFNDFATEDFITKNIRVRPVSGFTHADETKDGRQSQISKGQTENEGEGEDNYNKFAILELEDQRKAIKTKHRDALDEVRRKQALAAKEAEAKKNAK